ncbi:hypothetical protein JW926_07185 [Candidatus Sumerlaeota bacterium]|nr:hypothetical protein [Candidatus Sumerlaeota bacterium]
MIKFISMLVGMFMISILCPSFSVAQSTVSREFGDVKIAFEKKSGVWSEQYYAKDANEKWMLILVSPDDPRIAMEAKTESSGGFQTMRNGLYAAPPRFPFTEMKEEKDGDFLLQGFSGDVRFTKRISFRDPVFHIVTSCETAKPSLKLEYFLSGYAFCPDGKSLSSYETPDLVFAPGLRPGPFYVVGEHLFRSPVVAAQEDSLFAALMPDVDAIAKNHPFPLIIDLDVKSGVADAPLLSYGCCDHKVKGHVYFVHEPGASRKMPPRLSLEYDLYIDGRAPLTKEGPDPESPRGLHRAVQYMWDRYGTSWFNKSALPQTMPFTEYAKACFPAAFSEKIGNAQLGWWERTIEEKEVGGVYAGWGYHEGLTSWQAWFNNLRSAYGIRCFGERLAKDDWINKSGKMLSMALAAPQDRGAFPCQWNNFRKEWKGCLMQNAVGHGAYYDSVDMAWKAYWLLRWHQDIEPSPESLAYCRNLADFYLEKQTPSGAIPNWFTRELEDVDVLQEAAPTAMPAWFLAEFYGVTKEKKYLDAALKAGEFLSQEVIPYARYYDYEVFFSCSAKPCVDGGRNHKAMIDSHTGQPWQNTLCMQWNAELFKRLHEFTGEKRYLSVGLEALDYLCLYQNVWSISYRRIAYTFGGFGVQNSDGEYLDARQAQFGCTLCDYGALLGRRDLFERGVAALRASLTLINHPTHEKNGIYPNPNYSYGLEPENCGHLGFDHQCGRTGFDWGEGSGLAGIAYVMKKYGGVYIDSQNLWAVGIDGVGAEIDSGNVSVTNALAALKSPFTETWEVKAVVGGDKDSAIKVMGNPYIQGKKVVPEMLSKKTEESAPVIDPVWDFEKGDLQGWEAIGDFAEIPTSSARMDFRKNGNWFIGTCEDGFGGYDDHYAGRIYSPVFQTTKNTIRLKVGGGKGNDARVELRGGKDHSVLYAERGNDSERMEERVWDVTGHRNADLYIVIVDDARGGWGHINVDHIRCE